MGCHIITCILMISIFQSSIFQSAILIGILCSVICGIVGSFVVVKRMSFISGSIAHTAFGGLGLSYWLGFNPILGALGFGLFAAMGMGCVRLFFRQQEDALIGALWAVGMSVGVVCISLGTGYSGDLFGYLFGSLLLTSHADLMMMLALMAVVMFVMGAFYRAFQAISFDEVYVTVLNLPVKRLYLLLLALVTVTVIILMKVVGTLLVIALLTLPSAAARNFTNALGAMIRWSIVLGIVSTCSGIYLAFWVNLPPGPLIIFVASGLYLMSFYFLNQRRGRISR